MIKFLVSFGLLVVSANSQALEFIPGAPFIANYGSSYNSHVINHDIRIPVVQPVVARYAQPVVARYPQPIVARYAQPIVAQAIPINSANPEVLPARVVLGAQTPQNREGPNPDAQRRSSDPERLQNQRNEKLRTNEEPNAIPAPVLLGSRFLARNQAKPTPVPNGFVFSSRSVNPEDQRREGLREGQFRTAQFQILRNAGIREEPQRSNLRDGQDDNANGIQAKQMLRMQNLEEAKPESNIRPNIYSQIITF